MKLAELPDNHRSFYHLAGLQTENVACAGLACFVARRRHPEVYQKACGQTALVSCLGECFAAPRPNFAELRPAIQIVSPKAVILEGLAQGPARELKTYTERGGYGALQKAIRSQPGEILNAVLYSELRGRGGAGFSTGSKWQTVAKQASVSKYVIANADEGDAGSYIDRMLMEDDPHRLIEAMVLAGYAVGAGEGIIYLRKEYPLAQKCLTAALSEARSAGILGKSVLETDFCFEITIVTGEGSYVCGEESALLNSIEGKRPEPRAKPPYVAESGLYGNPTLVNNVETLAAIPWIIRHGGAAYHELGFSKSRGTKVVCLNSLFARPGLYEVEFGIPVRHILEDLGGGLAEGKLAGVLIGGPLAGVLPPSLLDVPFGFEELRGVGASVGHGGVIAFDESTSIAELVHHVFAFAAFESCGKCTPCRLGTRRVEEIFGSVVKEGKASTHTQQEYVQISEALRQASFCGFGTGLAEFARSVSVHYPQELAACFK